MDMKLCDFSLLDRCRQTDLLYEQGIYVGKRVVNQHIVVLYQVGSFYVEVIYKKYRCTIHSLYAFSSAAGIDAYLGDINVDDLVKCTNSI